MNLDNYAELKTSIVRWLIRDGDTRVIDGASDFIQACEQQLNYGLGDAPPLRIADMEAEDEITLVDGEGDLPDDFLQWRGFTTGTKPDDLLELGSLANNQYLYGNDASGRSKSYEIIGSSFRTYPAVAGPVTLRYYAKIPALSDARQTNWLLQKAPMVYLYGSLMHSAAYMQDDERAATWGQFYTSFLNGLINSDKQARFSRMRSRVSGPTP